MHFTDEEAAEVKAWVVKKLEDISDADSDVLADYVLALIRSDAPDDEIRKASIENLEDFLKENTVKFVDEIFEKYSPKPEPPPSQPTSQQSLQFPPQQIPFNQPLQPSNVMPFVSGQIPAVGSGQQPVSGFESNGTNFGRKRTFNDVSQNAESSDQLYGGGDRPFKVQRGKRGARGGWEGRGQTHHYSQQTRTGGYPGIPLIPGAGFPQFDPNDPVSAMMALQSMGLPQMPGMPQMPIGNPQFSSAPPTKIPERCKDYDTKGFCVLGSTCPYQHGPDHIVAPGRDDEYDPTKSSIVLATNGANGHGTTGFNRGSDRGRGRGRGRGDRGGFPSRGRNRADFSHAGPNEDQSITTIVVEQIPEDKFNEQIVRDFFSQFGNIVEITMKPHRNLALVKYDTYAAAKAAWSSPKVIFDNRFVKVYWYKPNATAEANGSQSGHAAGDQKPFDHENFQKQQAEAQKAFEEKLKKRKETEEAIKALEKQREELLKRQHEEQVKLMAKLASKGEVPAAEESSATAEKPVSSEDDKASEQTKALRAQLAALEEEAKSLGIDPNASTRGRGRGWPGYRGRGFYPPRGCGYGPYHGRGAFRGRGSHRGRGGVLRLDNRPKKVAVSGVKFDETKDEALRQYLLGIGDYESIESNPDRPDSLIVSFKERYVAEQLIYGPTHIPGVGNVEFAWVANAPSAPSTTVNTPGATSTTFVSGSESKGEGDTVMGNEEPDLQKNAGHEVDYDVAEDDTWAVE
ncbi:hypothetical protein VTO42DRAFT_1881 [Malbranchea cinnamomea]